MFFFRKNKEFSYDSFMQKAARFSPSELEKYNELVPYLREGAEKVSERKLGLKLIVISDSHGFFAFGENRLPEFLSEIEKYDLCILLGDIHEYDMKQIVKYIPKTRIIALRGNHDSYDLYEHFGIKEISGKTVSFKGVRFAGIEGSFRYKNGIFPSFTQYESLCLAQRMKEADVLLSHDGMFEHSTSNISHAGLVGITYYIYKYSPLWHIHGHLHTAYEKTYSNGTKEKCVDVCEYFEI